MLSYYVKLKFIINPYITGQQCWLKNSEGKMNTPNPPASNSPVPGATNWRRIGLVTAIFVIAIGAILLLRPKAKPEIARTLITLAPIDNATATAAARVKAHDDSVATANRIAAAVTAAIKAHDDSSRTAAAVVAKTPKPAAPTSAATPPVATPAPTTPPTTAMASAPAAATPVPAFTGRPEGKWADKVETTLYTHEVRINTLETKVEVMEVGEVMDLVTRAERYSLQLYKAVHDTTIARFMNATQPQRKLWWDAAFAAKK